MCILINEYLSLCQHMHSAPHTHNQGKSIKLIHIIYDLPYNIIFHYIFIIIYYILYYSSQELHIQLHLARFYHNDTLLYCALIFNNSKL